MSTKPGPRSTTIANRYGLFACLLMALPYSQISAQENTQAAGGSAGFAIEEVIVTARKRAESLQDVPISVSAFTGDSLDLRQVDSSERLGQVTPNLIFNANAPSSGHSSASQIFIRGIGQTDFLPTTDPGVGLYLDGVYLARSIGTAFDFFDVERVEVLRGPQGTLFGRNTIGGAIAVVTTKPSYEFSGQVGLKVGSDDLVESKLILNGPITDNLSGLLTLATKQRDGYIERNITGESLGDDDVNSFRGALLWSATENLEFYLSADYTKEDEEGAPIVFGDLNTSQANPLAAAIQSGCGGLEPMRGPPDFAGAAAVINNLNDPMCPNAQWAAGPYNNNGTGPVSSELEAWGVALVADWAVNDWLTIKSITAARGIDAYSARDADNTPFTVLNTDNDDKQDQFSQELQFIGTGERLNWVAGLYYFEETDENLTSVDAALGSLQLDGDIENDNIAVFGQATYDLTDSLSMTLGLRWTQETKRYTPDQTVTGTTIVPGFPIPNPGTCPEGTGFAGTLCLIPPGLDLVPPVEEDETFTETTPMASLSYQATDNILIYGTYAEGFKSGGFNARNVGVFPSLQTFDPEYANTFEIGMKSSLLDGELQLNGAVFYTDYTDLQFVVRQGIAPLLFNAGEASIQGIELEATWVPNSSWFITSGLGYIDAEYDEVGDEVNGVTEDNDLAQTPDLSFNLGIAYNTEIGDWVLTPRIDWSHTSDKYFDAINSPQLYQDDVDIFNAKLSLDSADGTWSLAAAVTNLTDEEYLVGGTSAFGSGLAYVEHVYAREREYSLQVRYYW